MNPTEFVTQYGGKTRPNRGGWLIQCPYPDHADDTPSFSVSGEGLFYCWGCFTGDALVVRPDLTWTPIQQMRTGDFVHAEGGPEQVERMFRRAYVGDLVEVKAFSFPFPIRATPNHEFYVVRSAYRREQDGKRLAWWKPVSELTLPADQLETCDWVKFPLTRGGDRVTLSVPTFSLAKKGPTPRLLPDQLSLTTGLMRMFGLYLAEGSATQRSVCFTFRDTEVGLSRAVCEAFEDLGLPTSVRVRLSNHTREVRVSSVHAVAVFKHWFGEGAASKRIPAELLQCPDYLISALLEGYLQGDGHEVRVGKHWVDSCETVSLPLAQQLYGLWLRLRREVTFYIAQRVGRQCVYRLLLPHSAQYVRFSGEYALLRVQSTQRVSFTGVVYNLSVEPSHRYVVAPALVSNCHKKGNFARLLHDIAGWSWQAAIAHAELLAKTEGYFTAHAKNIATDLAQTHVSRGLLGLYDVDWEQGYERYLDAEDARVALTEMPAWCFPFHKGFTPATLRFFDAGFDADWNRVTIPVLDAKRNLSGFLGRTCVGDSMKYMVYPPLSPSKTVYGLPYVKTRAPVLVEGAWDVWTLHQRGFEGLAIALMTSRISGEQAALLVQQYGQFTILFDGDKAGRLGAIQTASALLTVGCKIDIAMSYPKGVTDLKMLTGAQVDGMLKGARCWPAPSCMDMLQPEGATE